MFDLKITNATIVDGSGQSAFQGAVGVKDGLIAEVGDNLGPATREFDARGQLLTPGFVDIHTHYDGQVCWDKHLTPSCWHGVTTTVMGNCGVGFAPVRAGDETRLIELMESVEDIPGSALDEGIPWGWESYAEYLDAIDTPYVMDVGSQVPHVAVRRYVMGDRCYDDSTDADIASMASLTREALKAGAMGFSTSRFYGHLDKDGKHVPGTHAAAKEMLALGNAFKGLDHGTIEIITDYLEDDAELDWIEAIIRNTGRPVTVLTVPKPELKIWALADRLRQDGLEFRPQVGARPASILMSLEGTINPLAIFPSYKAIHHLPLGERIAHLRDPEFREKIRTEQPVHHRNADARRFTSSYEQMYPLDEALSYEPAASDSIMGVAEQRGEHHLDVLMDTLAEQRQILFFFSGYDGDLSPFFDAIARDDSVFGLSDGGAHCGVLCDASAPTYLLSYVARDRAEKLPVELIVNRMTRNTASLYGLNDRGLIAPGYLADMNIIDFEALSLLAPEMVYDLPSEGKRLIQKARGYTATIKRGEFTFENGEATGAMPGRLLRGGADCS
ncbi:D-aminoacylase [Halieaceae bacterium IMCC14734]|uniref:D-aminoacylase n=1 Tax=Candidatus Litorirhabdus singularis TaxID=2518993 RepID=A0ABT3TJ25_9GAMM|nr:amidohydrolase family protein [Candidatus Litorirhabdus singularis]MCX2982009.1 D-aminoacylase [Candidatus Litorirhabdus singularis]